MSSQTDFGSFEVIQSRLHSTTLGLGILTFHEFYIELATDFEERPLFPLLLTYESICGFKTYDDGVLKLRVPAETIAEWSEQNDVPQSAPYDSDNCVLLFEMSQEEMVTFKQVVVPRILENRRARSSSRWSATDFLPIRSRITQVDDSQANQSTLHSLVGAKAHASHQVDQPSSRQSNTALVPGGDTCSQGTQLSPPQDKTSASCHHHMPTDSAPCRVVASNCSPKTPFEQTHARLGVTIPDPPRKAPFADLSFEGTEEPSGNVRLPRRAPALLSQSTQSDLSEAPHAPNLKAQPPRKKTARKLNDSQTAVLPNEATVDDDGNLPMAIFLAKVPKDAENLPVRSTTTRVRFSSPSRRQGGDSSYDFLNLDLPTSKPAVPCHQREVPSAAPSAHPHAPSDATEKPKKKRGSATVPPSTEPRPVRPSRGKKGTLSIAKDDAPAAQEGERSPRSGVQVAPRFSAPPRVHNPASTVEPSTPFLVHDPQRIHMPTPNLRAVSELSRRSMPAHRTTVNDDPDAAAMSAILANGLDESNFKDFVKSVQRIDKRMKAAKRNRDGANIDLTDVTRCTEELLNNCAMERTRRREHFVATYQGRIEVLHNSHQQLIKVLEGALGNVNQREQQLTELLSRFERDARRWAEAEHQDLQVSIESMKSKLTAGS